MAVAAQAQLATATTAVTSDTAGTAGVTSENPQAKTYSCWPQYVQCYSLTTKSHQPVQWGHNLSFPIFRRQTRIRTKHSNAHKSQPMLHMCTEYNSEFFFWRGKNNQTQISVEKVEKGTKLFRQEPTDKGPARWREKANPPPWQGSQEGANPAPDGRTKRHKAHVVAKAKNVYNFFLPTDRSDVFQIKCDRHTYQSSAAIPKKNPKILMFPIATASFKKILN